MKVIRSDIQVCKLAGSMLKRMLLVSLSVFSVASCTPEAGRSTIYLIPDGYVGSFYILFNIPQGEPPQYEAGTRVYEIPGDGMLLMQSAPNEGWKGSDSSLFFYVEPDGSRTQITERWTTSLKDTPKNRYDDRVTVFGGGVGIFEPIRHCQITETGFYVGTRAQALAGVGAFDLFSERGVASIQDDVFIESCVD